MCCSFHSETYIGISPFRILAVDWAQCMVVMSCVRKGNAKEQYFKQRNIESARWYGVLIGLSRTFAVSLFGISLFRIVLSYFRRCASPFRRFAPPFRWFKISLFRRLVISHRPFFVSHRPLFVSHRPSAVLHRTLVVLNFCCFWHFRCFVLSLFRTFVVSHIRCFALSLFRTFVVLHFRCFALSLFRAFVVSKFCCFTVSLSLSFARLFRIVLLHFFFASRYFVLTLFLNFFSFVLALFRCDGRQC